MNEIRIFLAATAGMFVGLMFGVAVPVVGGVVLNALTEPTTSGQPQSMLMLVVAPFTLLGGPVLGGAAGIAWAVRQQAR